MNDNETYCCPKCGRFSLYYDIIHEDYECPYYDCGYASRFKHNEMHTAQIRQEPLKSRIEKTANKYPVR